MNTTVKPFKPVLNGTKIIFLARLSYCHLDAPWSNSDDIEKKYCVSAIVSKEDKETVAALKKAVETALEEGVKKTWKGKRPNTKASNFKHPIKDGDDERPDDEVYANSIFISCNSKTPVATLNRSKEKIDPKDVYSGCYGLVSLNFFPFAAGSNGIGAGLNAVLKYADGEKLGGDNDGSKDFDGIEGLDEIDDLQDM